MKSVKFLTMGAIALTVAGMAQAANVSLYITGSSAYRKETVRGIFALLGSSNPSVDNPTLPSGGGYIFDNGKSAPNASNTAVFKGVVGSDNVTIKTSFTGSAAGVQVVASTNKTAKFLPDSYTVPTDGSGNNTGVKDATGQTSNVDNPNEAVVAEVAMADCEQGSTPFNGLYSGTTYAALASEPVGIVVFQWVMSDVTNSTLSSGVKSVLATVDNMTPQLAQAQFGGFGTLSLGHYTGNSSDTTLVYATGRDPDSGTRIITFAESGIGINASVQQYDTATGALYTQQTVNGIVFTQGKGGEKSGSSLAGTAKMGLNGLTKVYVGYMGTSDAATLVTNGGKTLKYCGVAYSPQAVTDGSYTFWGKENILWKTTLAGTKLTLAQSIRDSIIANASVPLDSMNVDRTEDGGTVK